MCASVICRLLLQKRPLKMGAKDADKLKHASATRDIRDKLSKLTWSTGATVEGTIQGVIIETDRTTAPPKVDPVAAAAAAKKLNKGKKNVPKAPVVLKNVTDVVRSLGPDASMLMRRLVKYMYTPGPPPSGATAAMAKLFNPDKIPVAQIALTKTGESYRDDLPIFMIGHGMGGTLGLCCSMLQVTVACRSAVCNCGLQPGRYRGVIASNPMMGLATASPNGSLPLATAPMIEPCCCFTCSCKCWLECIVGCRLCCFRNCHSSGKPASACCVAD